jgi:hypothetical protein
MRSCISSIRANWCDVGALLCSVISFSESCGLGRTYKSGKSILYLIIHIGCDYLWAGEGEKCASRLIEITAWTDYLRSWASLDGFEACRCTISERLTRHCRVCQQHRALRAKTRGRIFHYWVVRYLPLSSFYRGLVSRHFSCSRIQYRCIIENSGSRVSQSSERHMRLTNHVSSPERFSLRNVLCYLNWAPSEKPTRGQVRIVWSLGQYYGAFVYCMNGFLQLTRGF